MHLNLGVVKICNQLWVTDTWKIVKLRVLFFSCARELVYRMSKAGMLTPQSHNPQAAPILSLALLSHIQSCIVWRRILKFHHQILILVRKKEDSKYQLSLPIWRSSSFLSTFFFFSQNPNPTTAGYILILELNYMAASVSKQCWGMQSFAGHKPPPTKVSVIKIEYIKNTSFNIYQ